MNTKEVQEVLLYLGDKGEAIIANYVHWYIIASLVYTGFGAVIIYLSFWISNKMEFEEVCISWLIKGLGLLIGLWIIFAQIPDLLAPQGIAIHRLILDLRGG